MATRPRRDDATYLLFFGAGMLAALGGGILLGALDRPAPHALLQAAGFMGMIVCGMGLRLVPRLARRPPLPVPLVAGVFVLQAAGVLLLLAGFPWVYTAAAAATCGLLLAALLPAPARRPGGPGRGWWAAALAGSLWWAAAALLAATGGDLPRALVLGVAMSFVWSVQSRMVRVFFGRPPARARDLAIPLALWEAGVGAGVLGLRWGWLAAGAGGVALCLLTGAVGGSARRLASAAAGAGPAIAWANRAGVAGSLLLAAAAFRPALADSAVHVFALSMASVLVLAMARLLAPVLAVQRATGGGGWDRPAWVLLLLSGAVRALYGFLPLGRAGLAAAGILAWLGLALFAAALARAVLGAAGARAAIEERAFHREGGPQDR